MPLLRLVDSARDLLAAEAQEMLQRGTFADLRIKVNT